MVNKSTSKQPNLHRYNASIKVSRAYQLVQQRPRGKTIASGPQTCCYIKQCHFRFQVCFWVMSLRQMYGLSMAWLRTFICMLLLWDIDNNISHSHFFWCWIVSWCHNASYYSHWDVMKNVCLSWCYVWSLVRTYLAHGLCFCPLPAGLLLIAPVLMAPMPPGLCTALKTLNGSLSHRRRYMVREQSHTCWSRLKLILTELHACGCLFPQVCLWLVFGKLMFTLQTCPP